MFNSGASALIGRKYILYERHKNIKDEMNKWSTIAGTFYTTIVIKIISKLPKLNHSIEVYAKCYLTNKLLNYDLILSRKILHKLGIIFNIENKTITW